MTKEEILDYIMNTPDNTNRMVLSDMLDEFSSSSGGDNVFLIHTRMNEDLTVTYEESWSDIVAAAQAFKAFLVYYDGAWMVGTWDSDSEFVYFIDSGVEALNGNILTLFRTSGSITENGVTIDHNYDIYQVLITE